MDLFNYLDKMDNALSKNLSNYSKNKLISFVSFLGSFFFTFVFLTIIIFLPLTNLFDLIITIIISLSLDTVIVFIVKFSVRRKRQNEKKYFNRIETYSFPSGHVSRLSAFIVPLIKYPIIIFFFIFLVILVSFARIAKAYHYFSDCFVGFIIGLLSGILSVIFSSFYLNYIKKVIGFFLNIL